MHEQIPALGQIVILNGAPRAGKSRLAAAIQETFPGVWMALGVDLMIAATPAHLRPGLGLRPGGERPDLEPLVATLYAALYESVAAHSRLGLNVVTDVGHHDDYATLRGLLPRCARRLDGLPVLLVGVRCPLEEIVRRRRDTGWAVSGDGDAPAPPVARWQEAVHAHGLYDLEVDTSVLTPAECAAAIRRRLTDGPPPMAFPRLAALALEKDSPDTPVPTA